MAITTHSGENGVRELWSAKEVSTSRRSWKDSRPYKAKIVSRSNLVGDERLGPRRQGRRLRLGTIDEQEGVLVGRAALRGRAGEDCHSRHQTPETGVLANAPSSTLAQLIPLEDDRLSANSSTNWRAGGYWQRTKASRTGITFTYPRTLKSYLGLFYGTAGSSGISALSRRSWP